MPQPFAHPRPRRPLRAALVGTAAAALVIVLGPGATSAAAVQLGPLTKVSDGDPFAGCTADNIAAQKKAGAILYPASELEPWVAADPSDPGRLIAGWQQDRWSNGGSRGLVAGVTRNGGKSWRDTIPRGVSECTGGRYLRSSDPWVSIAPDGTAYFMSLAVDVQPNGVQSPTAMLVSRSTDGGLSWGKPVTLIRDANPALFNDKNSITADPKDPDVAIAVWDRLQGSLVESEEGGGGGGRSGAATAIDGVELARDHLRAVKAGDSVLFDTARQSPAARSFPPKGPTLFSRTTDGGKTWSEPRVLYDPGLLAQTIGNVVVVLPDGTYVDFFNQIDYTTAEERIGLVRSHDKGRTWEKRATFVGALINGNGESTITPNKQQPVRDGNIVFHPAVDPKSGTLYVTWQDVRLNGIQMVLLARSTDGGDHWDINLPMNRTPANTLRLREQAFTPAVEVGPNGEVVLTYYDFRNDKDAGGESTDYWAEYCEPSKSNCLDPSKYTEIRLTNKSFDISQAPVARGYFLGDYEGLARSGASVQSVFSVVDGPGRNSIYGRGIDFGSKAEVASVSGQ
jgi:hypothetical protein